MEEDLRRRRRRRGDAYPPPPPPPPPPPRLLDLIPMERNCKWMQVIREDSGGGGDYCGFGVEEEEEEEEKKKLELRLGPPLGREHKPEEEEEEASVVLGGNYYYPKLKEAASKRGFSDTIETNKQGFLKSPSNASGRTEEQQISTLERIQAGRALQTAAAAHNDDSTSGNAAVAAAVPNNNTNTRSSTSVPVVGWPPIRSFRKNIATTSSKPSPVSQNGSSEITGSAMFQNCNNYKEGLFVKINMDGIPIGRKVDLKAYDSYEKLSSAVQDLFRGLLAAAQKDPLVAGAHEQMSAFTRLLDGSGEYTLVYQDTEGDKMLVGDVPWDMFIATAKRLRVLKSSDLSSLSLGAISRKRTATEC